MSSEKELTPEEKLLALIQQDKRPDPVPGAERASSPAAAPVAASAPPPPVAAAPAPPPAVVQPPPPAAPPVPAVTSPTPTPAAPKAEAKPRASVPPSAPAAAEAGPKLKLAPSPLTPPAKSPPAVAAPPAREAPAPGVAAPDKQAGAGAAPAAPAERPAAAAASPKAVKARVSSVLSWPILNRSLALVVLVLLVVVVYSVASIQSDIDKAMSRQVNQAGTLPVQAVGLEMVTPMPLEECLRKVSGRDIFRLADVAGAGAASNAAPAAAEFKLVGVSVDGRDPKASMAIVRSKTPPQTFFVKVGDAVGNTGFTLDRVLADRAILKKQKQEIEVR